MTYLSDLTRDSEGAVRERLTQDEKFLAAGRCTDITTTGDLDSSGAGWTYLMVTNRCVHWVPSIRNLQQVCSLDLDWVHACTEIHYRHRSALALDHDPLIRLHIVPNGRPPNWEYASMDLVPGPLSKMILGFSRPTTSASKELKGQLASRGIEVSQIVTADRLPEART